MIAVLTQYVDALRARRTRQHGVCFLGLVLIASSVSVACIFGDAVGSVFGWPALLSLPIASATVVWTVSRLRLDTLDERMREASERLRIAKAALEQWTGASDGAGPYRRAARPAPSSTPTAFPPPFEAALKEAIRTTRTTSLSIQAGGDVTISRTSNLEPSGGRRMTR